MRSERSRLTGFALIAGCLMFFTFWIFSATEAEQTLIEPWSLQLAFHGAQIITLITGLVLVSRLPIDGWPRHVWRAGAIVAAVGTPLGLPLFAGGILLMAVGAVSIPGLRVVGAVMIPGALFWLLLFSQGAMIGNEDYPPLTEPQQTLAVVGLVLIVTGLVVLGGLILRSRAPVLRLSGVGEKQPEHSSDER